MLADVLFSGVPVVRLGAVQPWYESLFGRSPDVVANDREVMWQVRDGGWLYVVEDEDRAGRALVAIAVADLDGTLDGLASRGIDRPEVDTVPGAGSKATVTDPDGNTVAFIEVVRPGA